MKKALFILFLVFCTVKAYSQEAGDLTVGVQGGYITYYKSSLYGLNLSYALSNPLEISLSGLMSPSISRKDELNPNLTVKNALYSANLDARLFLVNIEAVSMGPSLGVQYLYNQETQTISYTESAIGVNIGWHVRVAVTDNLRINGGWRYSTFSESDSYNMFYVGIGYAFNLF